MKYFHKHSPIPGKTCFERMRNLTGTPNEMLEKECFCSMCGEKIALPAVPKYFAIVSDLFSFAVSFGVGAALIVSNDTYSRVLAMVFVPLLYTIFRQLVPRILMATVPWTTVEDCESNQKAFRASNMGGFYDFLKCVVDIVTVLIFAKYYA